MSEDKKIPDYITQRDDGDIDIALRRPLEIDGVKVTALRMREPDVNDQLVAKAVKASDEVKELTGLANLCGIALEDIKKLKVHDLGRVQTGYLTFID